MGESPGRPVLRRALWRSGARRAALGACAGPCARGGDAAAARLRRRSARTRGWRRSPRPTPSTSSAARLEIAALWRRSRRPRLLAVIGPSGAGKSSLLRAGLLPGAPPGWRAVVCTPGEAAVPALAQALAPTFAGDAAGGAARCCASTTPTWRSPLVARWRARHERGAARGRPVRGAVHPQPRRVQERFARAARRLVVEADVHVVLALRDDFLFRCHGHEALDADLRGSDAARAAGGRALRRALVSRRCSAATASRTRRWSTR